jgi:hypothetical protein
LSKLKPTHLKRGQPADNQPADNKRNFILDHFTGRAGRVAMVSHDGVPVIDGPSSRISCSTPSLHVLTELLQKGQIWKRFIVAIVELVAWLLGVLFYYLPTI